MKMVTKCVYVVLLFIIKYIEVKSEFIEQATEEGKILGKTFLTVEKNKTCYAFQGIPYAEPPKRFQLPVKKGPWTNVLNCTYDKPECVQNTDPVTGSENCLTLSVYSTNRTGRAAVLFWIHGGGFTSGNGSYTQNGPDYFLNQDLVVVIIQYRLGVFGYLSTGDRTCPGNLGMKDQVLALNWTQRNIHHFGGDPDNITIAGVSAGAASVSYHLLSPKSQGKFKGAIMNSGTAECLWTLNRNAVKIAYKIGESFRIFTNDSKVLVSGLAQIDFEKLQRQSYNIATLIMIGNFLRGIQFGVVEEVPHDDAFYTGRADEMFLTGNFHRVPLLAGHTSFEFAIQNILTGVALSTLMLPLDLSSWKLAPASLTTNNVSRVDASKEIRQKFFGFLPMALQFEAESKFATVDQFVRPIERFIRNVRKYVPKTFYYQFSYMGVSGGLQFRPLRGVTHSEDQGYLWIRSIPNIPEEDKRIRRIMVALWSNFCKFGEPIPTSTQYPDLQNVTWLPASSSTPPFLLDINSVLRKIENPFQNLLTFYEKDIFEKYGQKNYNTY